MMNLIDNCAICRVSMARNAVIRLLPCRHLLHRKCAERLHNGPEVFCPICRVISNESEPIERQLYKKHMCQDRERIVANKGEDWVALAVALGVKYKTAFQWVHSGRDFMLHKGGIKPKILTDEQIDVMISWVEEECSVTLKQLQQKILQIFRNMVSVTTVGNYLEGGVFNIKQTHCEPAAMNIEENKRKRRICSGFEPLHRARQTNCLDR
jgi:transposase